MLRRPWLPRGVLPPLMILTLAPAGALRADSITFGQVPYEGVHVDRIEGGEIYFLLDGEAKDRPLSDVTTMTLDDQPQFNTAENAYQQKQWDAAAVGYSRAMGATDKDWLKDFIAPRLLDAANQSDRFDQAVAAWIRIAAGDAGNAVSLKPTPPPGETAKLDAAASELQDAVTANIGPSRRLMLGLLLEVQIARQDTQAAHALAGQLQAEESAAASDAGGAQSVEQETHLALARAALGDGKFDDAIAQIDSAAALMTDPRYQADSLFVMAQGLEGKAAGAQAWEDAALAYLRVYVHFPDGPASLHAAASLIEAAGIEEVHLQEPGAALRLYQKVVNEYKDSPEAGQAAREITRLSAAGGH